MDPSRDRRISVHEDQAFFREVGGIWSSNFNFTYHGNPPEFGKMLVGKAVFSKARVIARLGIQTVHSSRFVPPADALITVGKLFHVGYWLTRT